MRMKVKELIELLNIIQPNHAEMISLFFQCDGTDYIIEKTLMFFSLNDYRYEYCLSLRHESESDWIHLVTTDIDDIEIRLSWGYDKLYRIISIA